ncbi:MAG: hypothetical protein PVH00_01995, partial [Gemmatimonadota bacterium]
YTLNRVTDAIRFPDGTVVVANTGDNTLRYYDETGSYLRTAGGQGGGPEEFAERISGLRRLGDSVLVWQFALQSSRVFDHEGDFVRAIRAPRRPSRIDGVLNDGSHLFDSRIGSPPSETELYLDSSYVYLSDPDFVEVDSIGRFPAWYMVRVQPYGWFAPRAYGPRRVVAAGDDVWYYGWPEAYEFRVMNRDGSVRRIVRRAWEPSPVTDEDRALFRAFILGPPGAPGSRLRRAPIAESMVFPESYPAFRRIEPDPTGHVWAQRSVPGWSTEEFAFNAVPDVPTTWDVFDPSGAWLGSVTMPARFDAFDIGEDHVTGLWKDDLDVERVRVYTLVRPEGDTAPRP